MTDSPNRSVSRRSFLTGAGVAGALALAGCTEGPGSGTDNGLSGSIRISGSSTVYPVAQAVTEQFRSQNPGVEFNLSRDGSGGGFSNLFCEGNSDFNNASREISSDEEEQCSSNDIEYHEINVATDALTVIVNNDFASEYPGVTDMSIDQVRQIWRADGATTWQDVNGDWPDEAINRFGAADTSGTFDYFREAVLGEDANHTSDYSPTEQDNTILQGVQQGRYAIGYFGFSYYQDNQDSVTAVTLQAEDGDSYVEPTLENAKSGDYPLARPLFTYPKVSSLSQDHIAEFARYFLRQSANDSLIADQVGYVPKTEEGMQSELDALNDVISNA
jgi:phosphate transport system substrate-binding protein